MKYVPFFTVSLRLFCFCRLFVSCAVSPPLLQVGVEDITDVIEKFEDEVQSVDMTTMNRL